MRNFQPPRLAFDRYHKGRVRLTISNSRTIGLVRYGVWGLKLNEACRLTPRHLEAVRRTIARMLKRKGRLWIRRTSPVPVTSKPIRIRMGKGKGKVDYWAYPIVPGTVLFELAGVRPRLAVQALVAASHKLPVKVTVCRRFI